MKLLTRWLVLALAAAVVAALAAGSGPGAEPAAFQAGGASGLRFAGTVTDARTNCEAGGDCILVIDGKRIVVVESPRGSGPRGALEVPRNASAVGMRVEVFAAGDGSYHSLYGSGAYYVRPWRPLLALP